MLCSKQENSLYPTCWLGNAQHSFALVVLAELEGELDQDMGQVPVQCAVSLCASLCCYKWGNGWDIGMIKQILSCSSVCSPSGTLLVEVTNRDCKEFTAFLQVLRDASLMSETSGGVCSDCC